MNMQLTLTEETSFEDAVRALDEGGHGFIALTSPTGSLVGVLTDGDVRRSIINNTRELSEIINTKPEVAHYKTPKRKVISRLKVIVRRHMPLVDDDNLFKGVVTLDDHEWNSKPNSVVIMAGGLGSRLGELTKETPKPMLKIGSKPILEHIIENFVDHGFHHFYISVNYRKEAIKEYFGDGEKFGIEIDYLEETQRLGTAGALSLIKDDLEHSLVVVNGDVLTALNFDDFLSWHNDNDSDATMCVREFHHQVPYGVVNVDNSSSIVSMQEKPSLAHLINAGMYVLTADVVKKVPANTFYDMPTLFEQLQEDGFSVKAYVVEDYWIDVGMKEHYQQAQDDFA